MTQVPQNVAAVKDALGKKIASVVPSKQKSNLLIATWNLRAFGDLTEKWSAGEKDSPKRDWQAVALIAEVVSHFDVIAIQEVRRETTALRFLLAMLGPDWHAIVSDVTEGDDGNGERLTFVYDSTRVQPAGLVGEIVLPSSADAAAIQFARTPYTASFKRGDVEFILATVHILWGKTSADRLPEITSFAEWMGDWADRPNDWNENLIVLGDFNLDRRGEPLFDAFLSTGLWPPTVLNDIPRTIFSDDNDGHFYDQIAWFSTPDGTSRLTSLSYNNNAGSFDFIPHVFAGLTRRDVSWRISDHYPLWVEFRI